MKALFRHFFTTLRRFKQASALTVFGLSAAFAAFMLIMVQVRRERTFDSSFIKSGRIYRVESTMLPAESSLSSVESYTAFLARPLVEMLVPAIPQIESYTLIHGAASDRYVQYENEKGERFGLLMPCNKVLEGFETVFDMEMTEGAASSLKESGHVLLPQSLAKRMFADGQAVGKRIFPQSPGAASFIVGGVYRDFPENTSIANTMKTGIGEENKSDWMDWTYQLFVVLTPGASPGEVAARLKDLFDTTGIGKQMGFGEHTVFRLNLLEDIYYRHDTNLDIAPKGNRSTTHLLLSIALLVIGVAAINFLNFSTALTPVRIKGINIRKVLGSSARMLRATLLFEAVGMCLIAFLLSLIWVFLFEVSGLSSMLLVSVRLAEYSCIGLSTFVLSVLTGLLAGIYPAYYMTSFHPARVLKSSFGIGYTGRTFSILSTGFQFVISIGLIIAALFVWLQQAYLYRMETGLNDKQVAVVNIDKDSMSGRIGLLMEKLKDSPLIDEVSFSDWPVGFLDYYPYTYTQSPKGEELRFYYIPVSYNFASMMRLDITAGRGFEKNDAASKERKLIFNESAARQFAVKPGDRLSDGSSVTGIIRDFHFMNLRKPLEPMALRICDVEDELQWPVLYIRTFGSRKESADEIRACIATIDPQYPVDIRFFDQQFNETYREERKTSVQITLFGLLAVLISLMGVFGLVTFETQYRKKETGIRKVLGATAGEICWMFAGKFVWIVSGCFLIAAPLAWFGVKKWLESYPCQTPLYGWVFVLAFVIVLSITLITVMAQSRYAATMNPVSSLKNE
ncbi:MAG: ABC transporter permease [Tannerellaceae bacterium]|jgi:putative ABC transport system permease protein|nr:ABC transporter permease [Tannerellaceae bacterium]